MKTRTTDHWTVCSTLEWTTDYFSRSGIGEARLEAELLLSSVLRCRRLDLHLKGGEIVPQEILQEFRQLIKERQLRKPAAYILGEKEFMGMSFTVNEHTLIPRPETELLVEEALRIIQAQNSSLAADIGTGSGCIAVSLAALSSVHRVYATDISLEALKTAQENINRHGQAGKVILKQGNLLSALTSELLNGKLDIIASNPPYIPSGELAGLEPEVAFEPKNALDGGADGLEFYRILAREGKDYLRAGGTLILELNAQKSGLIRDILKTEGYTDLKILKDYSGLERILTAVR